MTLTTWAMPALRNSRRVFSRSTSASWASFPVGGEGGRVDSGKEVIAYGSGTAPRCWRQQLYYPTLSPWSCGLPERTDMPLKNLMVHLDRGERTVARLELAVSLAHRHQARLVGVFGQRAQAEQVGVVATWPSREYTEAAGAVKTLFEAATAGLAQAEWHDINRGGDAELLGRLTDYARFFDLVLLG